MLNYRINLTITLTSWDLIPVLREYKTMTTGKVIAHGMKFLCFNVQWGKDNHGL